MILTEQQITAAKARGCAFFPATQDQVARLSMQRRIFTLDGRPHIASRDGGGFLETHGTLMSLEGRASRGDQVTAETVDEAAAAEAETATQMAAEGVGGSAQVVRRRSAGARPRPPWRDDRRGA